MNRLPSPEIKSVMRRGRRMGAEGVQLVYQNRVDSGNPKDFRNLQSSRFAFVVPVSVDKRAVVRNRIRRLMRESVRLLLPSMTPGWDGVFLIRKRLPDAFTRVDERVRDLLKKAGILPQASAE